MPRAVILTALPVEYMAVRSHLTDLQEEMHPQGAIYERGKFIASEQEWEVGIVEVGAGNAGAAVEAERAIAYFQPEILLFVGIAGGIKDVAIGDVVAATDVYGYESGKVGDSQQFFIRPKVGKSAYALVQRAKAEARKGEWLQRLSSQPSPQPRVFVAPIAAGEKVLASTKSDIFQFLKDSYNDAVAVEMEGFGFLSAVFAYPEIKAIVIRGISDLIEGKNEDSKKSGQKPEPIRQEKASHHASAFAFEMLSKWEIVSLDFRKFSNSEPIIEQSRATTVKEPSFPQLDREKTYERFILRTEESIKILKQLENRDANKVISLVGLGGIGKTALCHHISTQAYNKKIIKKIIWIRAKKQQFELSSFKQESRARESTLTYEQTLREISCQIPEITNHIREDIDYLYKHIYKKMIEIPTLIVIYGLEDSGNPGIISTKLKPLLGNGRLILTSRKEVDSHTFQCDVNKMSRKDSKEFLRVMARDLNCETILKAEESKLSKILTITDGMPLAMRLVVSHHAKYWNIDRIIERLSSVSDEQKLYNYIFEDAWQELDRNNSVNAQTLLIYLSDDSEPIPLELLYEIKNLDGEILSKLDVDNAIKKLKQLSLVEITENIVSVHSLTAQFFSETLREQYE